METEERVLVRPGAELGPDGAVGTTFVTMGTEVPAEGTDVVTILVVTLPTGQFVTEGGHLVIV